MVISEDFAASSSGGPIYTLAGKPPLASAMRSRRCNANITFWMPSALMPRFP